MCVMDFVSHRGISLVLIGKSVIHLACLLNVYLLVPYLSMTKTLLYLRNVSMTKFIQSSKVVEFICTNKTKV